MTDPKFKVGDKVKREGSLTAHTVVDASKELKYVGLVYQNTYQIEARNGFLRYRVHVLECELELWDDNNKGDENNGKS